jgi:ligand-binding sensor domain-containing protein
MRRGRLVLAGGTCAALLFAGFVLWRASRALRESRAGVAAESRIQSTSRPLDRIAPAGFEPFAAPAVFSDAAVFQGRFHLCGRAGLRVYGSDGALVAAYRLGFDLPPAPLTAMAAGVAAGDAEPRLYIATLGEGLLIFDGRAFRQVRPSEPALRKLTAVLALPTGRILAGADSRGVLSYDGQRLEWFHPMLKDVPVTALAGNETELWVGTRDRGVLRWRAGTVEQFSEPEGLPDQQVLSLAVHQDTVYAGTAMGVAEFRGGRFARVIAGGTFAKSLLATGAGLLVGTLEEGIVAVGRRSGAPACVKCRPIQRMFEMAGHTFALAEDGLWVAESGAWRKQAEGGETLLADANISALAVDAAGRLWVGYFDRGLEIVEPGGARSRHLEDEHVFCVNRIVPDQRSGNTAVATANGLVLFDAAGHVREVLGPNEGLIANHVTDVVFRPGGMTVATAAGITLFDGAGARSLYAFHGLVNNHVYSLASAGDRLMAGTLGGLSVLDGDVVRASFTVANSGLKHNWITAIVPVDDGWLAGTYGAGVMKLTPAGRWEQFAELKAPAVVNPNAMISTGGRVYTGLLGGGLAVYSRSSGRWTTLTAGLPSLNVTAVAARGGVLWVGTDNGLVRVREEALRVE